MPHRHHKDGPTCSNPSCPIFRIEQKSKETRTPDSKLVPAPLLPDTATAPGVRLSCVHLGPVTSEIVPCTECVSARLRVFECKLHGKCTIAKPSNGIICCRDCNDYVPSSLTAPGGNKSGMEPNPSSSNGSRRGHLRWAYGVTTVPSRAKELLPFTLNRLKSSGFDNPRLFVDGVQENSWYAKQFDLPVTTRFPAVGVHGNWVLSMHELFIRNPNADRFAIFQDDLTCCGNLRTYLDGWYPDKGYLNLYTWGSNYEIVPRDNSGKPVQGWFLSNQFGRGAVGLVFNRETLLALLSCGDFISRPLDATKGTKKVDGGIITALKKLGYREYVHNPSLLQHTGTTSTTKNLPHPPSPNYAGDNFDALSLVR